MADLAQVKKLTREQAARVIDEGRKIKEIEWCFSYYPKQEDYKRMSDAARKELAAVLNVPLGVLRDFKLGIQMNTPVRFDYEGRSGEEIVRLGFEAAEAWFFHPIGREGIGYELFKIISRGKLLKIISRKKCYAAYLCNQKGILESYGQFVSPKKESPERFLGRVKELQGRLGALLESVVLAG